MLAALTCDEPVIYLEHKLLADYWLEFLGSGGRKTVSYDVPSAGARGPVPGSGSPSRRQGRCTPPGQRPHHGQPRGRRAPLPEAAAILDQDGIACSVIDLRSVSPLDVETITQSVAKTRRLLIVDEDYQAFGLSGELAAIVLEAATSARYARVCTQATIPYARRLEDQVLPNTGRIIEAAKHLLQREQT